MLTMPHRLFIALPISESLQEKILKWEQEKLSKLSVRFVSGKNLHITLIPPWEETNVNEVAALLQQTTLPVNQFPLSFHTVSYGPPHREPNLIWAEGSVPPHLLKLKEALENTVQRFNYRPFRLHLTLARFRPKTFFSFPIKQLRESVDWRETVQSVALMESKLLPTGAKYTTISKILLTVGQ